MDIITLKYFICDDEYNLLRYEENIDDYIDKKIEYAKQGIPVLLSARNQHSRYAVYFEGKWYTAVYDNAFAYWRDLEEIDETMAREAMKTKTL